MSVRFLMLWAIAGGSVSVCVCCVCCCCFCFFFQAEDGRRELVRSRRLEDAYKRRATHVKR